MAAMTSGIPQGGMSSNAGHGHGRAMGARAALPGTPGGPWLYGRWAHVPAQKRSARSFLRFLDAAEDLLDGRHWHDLSVQDIVRSAKASVGSFYNRFSDKDALLHCLDDRLSEEVEQTFFALMGECDGAPALVADVPGIVVSLFMRLCERRGGLIRALELAHKMNPDHGPGRLGARFDMALEKLAAYLVTHDDALHAADADRVVRAFHEAFSLARERLIHGGPRAGAEGLHRMLLAHYRASLAA